MRHLLELCRSTQTEGVPLVPPAYVYGRSIFIAWCYLVIDQTPNPFGKSRTEPSAEIGHIYRTRSAVLAEHSSVGRTIVRQKNSSVRFGRNRVRSITSLYITFTVLMAILVIVSLVLTESVFHRWKSKSPFVGVLKCTN